MNYEEEYGDTLMSLAKAAGELTAKQDIVGIRFLIECCDAILGRALQLIGETEMAKQEGRVN